MHRKPPPDGLTNVERALAVIFVMWFISVLLQGILAGAGYSVLKVDYELSGQLGDSFGALSAVMATAAATGAWRAVTYQRHELEETRRSATQAEKLVAKRDFESAFFNLLDLFQKTKSEKFHEYKNSEGELTGGFPEIVEQFNLELRISNDAAEAYSMTFLSNMDGLAVYFRLLYNIIKLCEDHSEFECYRYIKILRSFLSDSELIMIALNGIHHDEGARNFKPLINRHCLLNNLSDDASLSLNLRLHYDESAFIRSIG